MPEALKNLLIRLFRVSKTPTPPSGKDLKTFRAAPNYFKYSLLSWLVQLLITCAVFVVSTIIFVSSLEERGEATFEAKLTAGVFLLAVSFGLVSLFFRFLTLRLDYEFRWYMVTDSGLRIREGILTVHEITMAFKNIQNVTINQGPIQRLLGISDLVVQTAGGSSPATQGNQQQGVVSSHTGYFRGVDNAEDIRDVIMARLRKVKGAGLHTESEKPTPVRGRLRKESMEALRAAAAEARHLKEAIANRE